MLLFQIVADRLGLGDRDGDEESGDVGDEFHAFLSCFLHEDRRSVLNEAEILGALCVERFDLFIVAADADHRILRGTVAVRPGRTAGVLVDVYEFFDDILIGGDPDHRAHALAIHGEALGQGVGTDRQNILREAAEETEESSAFLLLAAVVKVCHIRNQDRLLRFILDRFF